MMRQLRYFRLSPMTTASAMKGENFSWFSISEGGYFAAGGYDMSFIGR
jgi:hypothetical protein